MKQSVNYLSIYVFFFCLVLAMAGCKTVVPETQRIAPYKPLAEILPPMQKVAPIAKKQSNPKVTPPLVVAKEEQQKDSPTNIKKSPAKPTKKPMVKKDAKPLPHNPTPSVQIKQEATVGGTPKTNKVEKTIEPQHDTLRLLKSGDQLVIDLRGIPKEVEINDVIDGWGEVTLPLLGEVKIVGKTISEAEREIEKLYVSGGIYKHVNVIVMAEDEVFFVQGEVTRQGKFELSGKVTLLQAISEAGGFTPFAQKKKIKVHRNGKILTYNYLRITDGKDKDPLIYADDKIEVLRRWL